ncbi:MAG: hypothetical protein M1829_003380 [Trizodia sp. TS-e1964]|nr:MAG: hypothetical protein M1829_003380 [Trizodia sp. TS-e1964]
MGLKGSVRSASPSPRGHSGTLFVIVEWALRVLQFVMALAVCGLYGTDLNNAKMNNKYADPKWVYAVVIAGFSAITCVVYAVPFIKSHLFFAWDAILFILWVAVFGIFGKMYIHEDPEGDSGIQRMKNAVWVDLVNMLLWLITACLSAALFFKYRHTRSLHTGRANV